MLTLLYVDDEQINLDLMQLTYKRDFVVYKALSGVEALKMLQELEVTVMLTDYKMPEMNGLELIRKVKSLYPHIHCMLLTGYDESAINIDLETRNLISDFIQKPFKKSELKELVLAKE